MDDKERIETDIRGWDAILDHRTGTDGDQQTAEWLADSIRSAGAEPLIEPFAFQRRILHECSVTVGSKRAEGVPLFDGSYTCAEGCSAKLTSLESGTVDRDNAIDQEGHIGVTSFSSTGAHPPTRQMHVARSENYSAIVAYAAAEYVEPGLALLNAPHYQSPYGPPVLQVSTEYGDWLEAAAANHEAAYVVAHVSAEETTASNVQATISGRDPSLAPLVVMTPRSAWWTCTAERGGGIALWLECIRHFSNEQGDRDVIFTANTGHELGHVGLHYYLEQRPDLLGDARAWIHLGANFATVDSRLRFQASPALMKFGLEALATEEIFPKSITPTDNRPLGEAENIYDGGGRYLSFIGSNRWFHHPDDRWPYTVDLERAVKLNRAVIHMATGLAQAV
ncbi:MAG: hypothetical protein AAF702_23500 [Chloroflexota bacterium]